MRRGTVRDHVRIEMHKYTPWLKRSSNLQWWAVGWSEKELFFEIEKSVVLKS